MAHMHIARIRAALLLLGLSFGYVEAAVVVYLRALSEPVRQKLVPQAPKDELFPLLGWDRTKTDAPEIARLIPIEVAREAATIVMLASTALLVSGRGLWLPSFALLFGAWDASFYLFLKVMLNWPPSVFTWDLLFLIPVPWTAPVLAPLLVSVALMACGWASVGRRLQFSAAHWICMLAGNLAILSSFITRYREVLGGALPIHFPWPVFSAGLIVVLGAFVQAFRAAISMPPGDVRS